MGYCDGAGFCFWVKGNFEMRKNIELKRVVCEGRGRGVARLRCLEYDVRVMFDGKETGVIRVEPCGDNVRLSYRGV